MQVVAVQSISQTDAVKTQLVRGGDLSESKGGKGEYRAI